VPNALLTEETRLKYLALLLAICFSASACAAELVISKDIAIDYRRPDTLSHSQRLLIFKYDDWHFSHEVLDPSTIYPSVDLAGMERIYIESLFEERARDKLPEWMAVLSREQSEVFAASGDNVVHVENGDWEIRGSYSEGEGNIFILEPLQIHHLSMRGDKKKFTHLIEAIRGR
jgi:hypothetical protein